MGMPKEPNDYLIDAAPALLEACREVLGAFQRLRRGQETVVTYDKYCRILEEAIAEAERPL